MPLRGRTLRARALRPVAEEPYIAKRTLRGRVLRVGLQCSLGGALREIEILTQIERDTRQAVRMRPRVLNMRMRSRDRSLMRA